MIGLRKRHPALIILQALLDGDTIEIPIGTDSKQKIFLGNNNEVLIPAHTEADGVRTDVGLKFHDFDLQFFINMCEKMSDEEVTLVVFDNTLRTMRRSKK